MSYEINNIQKEFKEICSIISFHKDRAYRAVNTEVILTNWEVGKYVSQKLRNSEWGQGVVDNLVDYLKKEQPDLKGYNRRTIYRMVQFYDTYSSTEFVSAMLSQIEKIEKEDDTIVSAMPTQLQDSSSVLSLLILTNWTSHLEILAGCKIDEERIFYILLSHKEKLTYRELRRQIESSVYERSLLGEKQQSSKLKETYPSAKQLFKDSYMVDFLNLPEVHSELSLQQGLIEQMKKFNRSLSPTMVTEYKQKLIPKEVLRRHLREYYEEMLNEKK